MKFQIDHDYHIHSNLSPCACDPEWDSREILRYAEKYGLKRICLTDHFWDEDVKPAGGYLSGTYRNNGKEKNFSVLPLPTSDKVEYYFGCEGEMDLAFRIGITPETVKKFAFIIIPTTHLHMNRMTIHENATLEERAVLYVQRLTALLDSDLPSGRTGIAHLTDSLIANKPFEDHLRVLDMIPDSVFEYQFRRVREKDYGVEVNIFPHLYTDEQLQTILRPYRIAKEQGCKFYLGSDAHTKGESEKAIERFARNIELLGLTEEDKYRPFG